MSLTPRTLKIFSGIRLDDDILGQKELDYRNYPGLEAVVSQLEVVVPANTEAMPVVFPLDPNGFYNFMIIPQYDRLDMLRRVYQAPVEPYNTVLTSYPEPVVVRINDPEGTHSFRLYTTRQFFIDDDILFHYGGNGIEGADPVTWYLTNTDATRSQTIRFVQITFTDFLFVD